MKKLLRFAGVTLLALTISVASCGGDDDPVTPVVPPAPPPAPPPIVGTVSGMVSVEGSGLAGVSVNAASQSATTGSSGGYSFANVPAGTHSVQISGAPADVAFTSTTMSVTIATSGQMATADFSGTYIRTSSITGSVTAGGEGVVATVTATGMGMLTDEEPAIGSSDADGNFELPGLRAGSWMVTISDYPEGTEFPVTTRSVTVGVGLSAAASFNALGEGGPTTGTGVFLIITGVTDDDDDDDKTSGRVTATIDIERGDARFEKIALYVDGAEVDTRLFGVGRAPAEEPALAAQQVGVEFKLSFDSDEYDQDDPEAAVTYENGTYSIMAGVTVVGSEVEEYSQQLDVELENDDAVYVTVSGETKLPVIGADGGYWYGGPDAGFDLRAVPVVYSGRPVPSVTLRGGFCGENDAVPLTEAPYDFTPDCDGWEGPVEAESFSIGTAQVKTLNAEDEVFSIKLDYKAPSAPTFAVNPNGREAGWINDDVQLVGQQKTGTKGTLDGWLNYGAEDLGVGGYIPRLRYSPTTPNLVDGAVAADPSSEPTLPAATKANAICFIASAVDLLGNESKLPKAGTACASEVEDDAVTTDVDESLASVTKAGVDITVPTIDWTAASLADNSRNLDEPFEVRVTDEKDGSGLHSSPVVARVAIRDTKKMTCGTDEDGLPGEQDLRGVCANTGEGIGVLAGELVQVDLSGSKILGYYTLTGRSQDKAGNKSDEISRLALYDKKDGPIVAVGVTQGSDAKSAADYKLVGSVTDDLSVRSYSIGVGFPTADPVYYELESAQVDVYDADPLTKSVPLDRPIPLPFQAVQHMTKTRVDDATIAGDLRVLARDHGGSGDGMGTGGLSSLVGKELDDLSLVAYGTGTEDAMGFVIEADNEVDDNMLQFEAKVTNAENPFNRVMFYAALEGNDRGPPAYRYGGVLRRS